MIPLWTAFRFVGVAFGRQTDEFVRRKPDYAPLEAAFSECVVEQPYNRDAKPALILTDHKAFASGSYVRVLR